MTKVTTANDDYLVYFHLLTIVSNVFMRNGTYPLMFIGRVYNSMVTSLGEENSEIKPVKLGLKIDFVLHFVHMEEIGKYIYERKRCKDTDKK